MVPETRAWTFHKGMKAPQVAGVIHSDFERGFIRAEVVSFDDLDKLETMQKVKEAGKLRLEVKITKFKTVTLLNLDLTSRSKNG